MAPIPVIWTPEEVSQLKKLRALGRSKRDIARDLGKTPGQVSGKISRLELPLVERIKPEKIEAPPPEPPPRLAARPKITGQPVPFLEADERHCRALLERYGPNGERMCCGNPVVFGRSWCKPHCEIFFQPLQAVMRRYTNG